MKRRPLPTKITATTGYCPAGDVQLDTVWLTGVWLESQADSQKAGETADCKENGGVVEAAALNGEREVHAPGARAGKCCLSCW